MTINSRAKGARGELAFSKVLQEFGFEARRGQQHAGGPDSPDVITDLPGYHFEVKRVEKGSLYDWLEQATRDCGNKVPVVAHRRSRKDWVAILPMDDFLRIVALKELGV